MWETIQHITTPLALIAFLAALATVIYRRRLEITKEMISSAEPTDRAKLIESLSNTYHLDSKNLTKDQTFKLVQQELEYKIRRQKIFAITLIIMTIILASTALIGYSMTNKNAETDVSEKESRKHDSSITSKSVQKDFFQTISENSDSLVKTNNYESQLRDQLLKLFIESSFAEPYFENSNWDEILYSLTAASAVVKSRMYDFKRTPDLEKEFFKLNTILTDMRNEITYKVYSQSFSIFKHWEMYGFDKLNFTTNLPKRKVVPKSLLNELNIQRQSLIHEVAFIKKI
jgi:hypothetical protein